MLMFLSQVSRVQALLEQLRHQVIYLSLLPMSRVRALLEPLRQKALPELIPLALLERVRLERLLLRLEVVLPFRMLPVRALSERSLHLLIFQLRLMEYQPRAQYRVSMFGE
jgi:hypothetical protein